VKDWQQFEALIAAIHRVLNASDFDVESDIAVEEPSGAQHQIDVLLRPRTSFCGPILVSCKAWSAPVGIDHVREWADIVQHTGAAAGVIVAQVGFTSAAIDAARNLERRISLWRPRQLTVGDFGARAGVPGGFIARVQTRCVFREPRPVEGSFEIDVERADGLSERGELPFIFAHAERKRWYLRNEDDDVTDNLWDIYVARAEACLEAGVVEYIPSERRFLVLGGIRLQLKRFAFEVQVQHHEQLIEVDLVKHAIGYENMVTQE
jgi:hypothetical protein